MDYSYLLKVAAEKHPSRTALIYEGERWSYARLDSSIDALARGLAAAGLSGRTVASLLSNQPATVVLYLALARVGAVSVAISTKLLDEEVEYILTHSQSHALVIGPEHRDLVSRLRGAGSTLDRVISADITAGNSDALGGMMIDGPGDLGEYQPTEESPAVIMYTSGTTGSPKGVVRTHRAQLWNAVNSALGSPRTHDDVELFTLPIFGLGFIHFAMPTWIAGGCVVLANSFDADRTWTLLEEHEVTKVFLAPTMIDSMLRCDGQESVDTSRLQTVYCAYEFPDRLREAALARFGNKFIYMYGLTEAQLFAAEPGQFASNPSSSGKAMGVMRVKILDPAERPLEPGQVGQIALQGPAVMDGYFDDSAATATALSNGWLLTGDLGYLDEANDLHMTGRLKEIIKSGGATIDPIEVENALLTISGIREACVVGVPNDHWGEQAIAFVSLDGDGAPGLSSNTIIARCKERVASFKAPKQVRIIPELPKNPTGKVERGKLRELWTQHTDEEEQP